MTLSAWAPVPLRAITGAGLTYHGGIKLFAEGGHANISHLVNALGVPWPDLAGWVVGIVEFGGGIGLLLGVLFPLVTAANALNVLGLIVAASIAGGIPPPLAGGDPLPEWREAALIGAAMVSLYISGPGKLALHNMLAADRDRTWRDS